MEEKVIRMSASLDQIRLSKAPRSQSKPLVIISGLGTTIIALFIIYFLSANTDDFNVMGWYANYVLPVGAILVGIAASAGYGIASWVTGVKITRSLLWTVLGLQTLAYFSAQFIEFQSFHFLHLDGTPVGFFEYFDSAARSFAWKQNNGSMGQPLGLWGYAFRALEIIGFSAGGLIVPLMLSKAPYCENCELYKRKQDLILLPASLPIKKIKKSDKEGLAAHNTEQAKAIEQGKELAGKFRQLALDKTETFQDTAREFIERRKEIFKLPARIQLQLIHCRRCIKGSLVTRFLLGQGNQITQTILDEVELPSDAVQFLRKKK